MLYKVLAACRLTGRRGEAPCKTLAIPLPPSRTKPRPPLFSFEGGGEAKPLGRLPAKPKTPVGSQTRSLYLGLSVGLTGWLRPAPLVRGAVGVDGRFRSLSGLGTHDPEHSRPRFKGSRRESSRGWPSLAQHRLPPRKTLIGHDSLGTDRFY